MPGEFIVFHMSGSSKCISPPLEYHVKFCLQIAHRSLDGDGVP